MGSLKNQTLVQRLLDEKEASIYINMSVSYLQQSRSCGAKLESKRKASNTVAGPMFKKIGNQVRYEISDLDAWIDSFKSVSTLAELNADLSNGLSMDSEEI